MGYIITARSDGENKWRIAGKSVIGLCFVPTLRVAAALCAHAHTATPEPRRNVTSGRPTIGAE